MSAVLSGSLWHIWFENYILLTLYSYQQFYKNDIKTFYFFNMKEGWVIFAMGNYLEEIAKKLISFQRRWNLLLYLISNLQPCERIRSLHKSLIPFKNLRWRERIGERNVVPQGKDPSGSAWGCTTRRPTSTPWPSTKVIRGHHAAPHRRGTPQVIQKGNNGVKVISFYFGERIFLVSHCVLVVNFLLINI